MTQIKYATTEEDFLKCWHAIGALRPTLTKERYLELMVSMKIQGYQLLFVEENDGFVPAILGFRYLTMLYCGNIIYIDDLSTLPEARGKGYGNHLLDFVINLAHDKNLDGVHLDSGHQRFDAHRLYLNKKFNITSHHFALSLPS